MNKNQIQLAGNVVEDLVVKTVKTKKGDKKVTTLKVAVNEGQRKPVFVSMDLWDEKAEKAAQNYKKGDKVTAIGKVKQNIRDVHFKDGDVRKVYGYAVTLTQAKKEKEEVVNKMVVSGRLTKDPEIKVTTNGKYLTRLTVAVNENNRTQFIDFTIWDQLAQDVADNYKKGELVTVTARIKNTIKESKSSKGEELRIHDYDFNVSKVVKGEGKTDEQKQGEQTTKQETPEEELMPWETEMV